MEDSAIIELWKAHDKKLEESLVMNRKQAAEITMVKVQSLLASMKPLKIFTVLAGIVWVVFVDLLVLAAFHVASPFFLVSAGLQSLLTTLAIGVYIYQLALIHSADADAPVLVAQERLSRLRSSTLWIARLLFLQLPLWTTFYWNKSMLDNGNIWLYMLQLIITVSLAYIAVWLFLNITYENRNKKWFRLIFNGKEWDPVIRSIELLDDIKNYRNEGK